MKRQHSSVAPGRARSVGPPLWLLMAAIAWPATAFESLKVEVHRTIPHDPKAYTQGLVWWNGSLYESTGRYGHSELRRLDPVTGEIQQRVAIPVLYFGEGLGRFQDRLIMLTWRAELAFAFDLESFDRLGTIAYRGQGWGLCHDGQRFVMSDGSSRLRFRDSESFELLGSVVVTLAGRPLGYLNELECVAGAVYANVYQRDFLVRIDPSSGRVTQRIDASALLTPQQAARADVLNGVAHDPEANRFYLTGKLWPVMFEATFQP